MSMAMAYALKKRSKKMAEGGVAGVHHAFDKTRSDEGRGSGTSVAGNHVRGARMAQEKGQHRAEASRTESAKNSHRETLSEMQSQRGQDRTNLAEGGCVDCDSGSCMAHGGDIVSRAMAKRMAKGGVVSNDDDDRDVEFAPDQFDDLELDDHLEASHPGSNEIGDERLEDDDRDVVSRVMKSRRKGDRMPRPA